MLVKAIHHQTAKKILRRFSYITDTHTVKEIYKQIKNGHSCLLRTGAKIIYDKGKIYLSGYAMDGSDVTSLLM